MRKVWPWEAGEERARERLLIVRREADGSHKYSLSNASADPSWERLGFMQCQRYFIECTFEDAKNESGKAQYEVRGWRGWHHHIALCCLALLVTVRERIAHAEAVALLSVRDTVELLEQPAASHARSGQSVGRSARAPRRPCQRHRLRPPKNANTCHEVELEHLPKIISGWRIGRRLFSGRP